jgi:hypothetical protein
MIDFKLTSLDSSGEATFIEWKIAANSKLSKGSIMFTYEYKSSKGEIKKLEKYKSSMNGITIIKLSDIKSGDTIKNGDKMFSFEKCTHPIECNEMCGVCGEDLRTRTKNTLIDSF